MSSSPPMDPSIDLDPLNHLSAGSLDADFDFDIGNVFEKDVGDEIYEQQLEHEHKLQQQQLQGDTQHRFDGGYHGGEDGGGGDGGSGGRSGLVVPKRKSLTNYDPAPVIRRRHSKEEWSSEIDFGDGRPKRRHSGDARSADWAVHNNMFGNDGGGPRRRANSGDARSSNWANGNNFFDSTRGTTGSSTGLRGQCGMLAGDPFRRRCNSDSKLQSSWGDVFDDDHDDPDAFGELVTGDSSRLQSERPKQRRHSASAYTPNWAFDDDLEGSAHGDHHLDIEVPLHSGLGPHNDTAGLDRHYPRPLRQQEQQQQQQQQQQYKQQMMSNTLPRAGAPIPRRYSDSGLSRWHTDDFFSEDEGEPVQRDNFYGGAGGGAMAFANKMRRRTSRTNPHVSGAMSDSALAGDWSDDEDEDDDFFGTNPASRAAAADAFSSSGNGGADHAQLFASRIPAYRDNVKMDSASMRLVQQAGGASDDITRRKIAEMKEQIARLQNSMAALESTVETPGQDTSSLNDGAPYSSEKNQSVSGTNMNLKPVAPHGSTCHGLNEFSMASTPPPPMLPVSAVATTSASNNSLDPMTNIGQKSSASGFKTNAGTLESYVDPITKLNSLMAKSQQSLKQLQDYDKSQGLPASHCSTMVKSARSRKQLLEGRILKKWDGTPMIEFDEHGRAISEEERKKVKKEEERKKKAAAVQQQAQQVQATLHKDKNLPKS